MAGSAAANCRFELLAGFALAVVGMDVFIIQPGIVQAFVDPGGLSEGEAGYVAAAEMFGIALATIAMVPLARRCSWRRLALGALLANATANFLGLLGTELGTLTVLRALAGLSSGVLISIGYALVGRNADPDRHFGILIACVLLYSAAGLFVLPGLVAGFGLDVVFIAIGVLPLAALAVVRFVPAGITRDPTTAAGFGFGGREGPWLLGSVLAFFLGQGVVWPYLALIGMSGGASVDAVGTSLMVSQILAIGGAVLAAWAGSPARHGWLLAIGTLATVVPMLVFGRHPDLLSFGVAVAVFNIAANLVTPLLMAIIATSSSPQLVVTGVAVQMLGLAIGPAAAASLVQPQQYGSIVLLGILLFVLSLFCGLRGRRLIGG